MAVVRIIEGGNFCLVGCCIKKRIYAVVNPIYVYENVTPRGLEVKLSAAVAVRVDLCRRIFHDN